MDLRLGTREPEAIFGDVSNVYVSMVGIWKLPYAEPEALVETPVRSQTSLYSSFSTDGDYVSALDSSTASTNSLTPSYLMRTPLDGVAWKRFAKYPGKTTHLVLDGPTTSWTLGYSLETSAWAAASFRASWALCADGKLEGAPEGWRQTPSGGTRPR